MRSPNLMVLVCLTALTLGIATSSFAEFKLGLPKFRKESASIVWQDDLKAAHQIAVREKKPMLIKFGASWCTYCKKMDENSFTDKKMVEYVEENFVPVYLDFDKHLSIANTLEVKLLPAIVILSPEADLLGRTEGFKKTDALKDDFDKALKANTIATR